MNSTSFESKFKKYEKVFYPLPPLPESFRDHPPFGSWTTPARLPDNWAMKHFIYKFVERQNFKILEAHASRLRPNVRCRTVSDEVIAGGQHVLIKIRFEDGVEWVARIMFPQCEQSESHKCMGGYWHEKLDDRIAGMESEIATLQYVRSRTSVPVPKVFGYDLNRDNDVGGPYILMEMIPGESVAQRIERQGGISGLEVQRIVAQTAAHVAQISSLRFSEFGRLRFNMDSPLNPRLEPVRGRMGHPFKAEKASEYLIDTIHTRIWPQRLSDKDPPDHWTTANTTERRIIAASIYRRAALMMDSRFTGGPYPLQHLDLNQQNIMVDKECNVRAIIDWEGAKVVPFESYDNFSSLLFKRWWQEWEGLGWTDEFAVLAFEAVETQNAPRLSVIHRSPMGELGRKLDPLGAYLDFAEKVGELVTFLYESFEDVADKIVSKALAEEIVGYGFQSK